MEVRCRRTRKKCRRQKRLLKKCGKQILRGLKPLGMTKIVYFVGTTEVVSWYKADRKRVFQQPIKPLWQYRDALTSPAAAGGSTVYRM